MSEPKRRCIRAMRVPLASLVAVVFVLAVAGCGRDEQGPRVPTGRPAHAGVHAVVPATSYGLYWVGRSFDALRLSSVSHDDGVTTFIYGTCEVTGDEGGCMPPLEIQVESLCTRNALMLDVPPRARFRMRGITILDYGEGDLAVATGDSNVLVAAAPQRARRAVAALRPVKGAQRLSALPQPRYPLYYVAQLRSVQNVYARTKNLRAVRTKLGISKSAARFELALGRELGAARLRRGGHAALSLKDAKLDRLAATLADERGERHAAQMLSMGPREVHERAGRGRANRRDCQLEPASR